jgi:integration host factor subunit beta
MVKSELIEKLAEKLPNFSTRVINLAVNEIIDEMSDALSNGNRVEIRGFGSFAPHYLPPRNAHNPRTGERVATNGKYTPHFKPGKELRLRVNHHSKQNSISD